MQIEGSIKKDFKNRFFGYGDLKYGFIQSGQNQDSDYSEDNRTDEFSRSVNSINGDNTLDMSDAIGYHLTPPTGDFRLSMLVGISSSQQNLRMTNGYQVIDSNGPTGPISDLNSTYQAQWRGVWLGFNLEKEIISRLIHHSNIEYHFSNNYYGVGDWNLRDDLAHPVSFIDNANCNGYLLAEAIDFAVNASLKIQFKIDYSNWATGSGTDQTFYSNGRSDYTCLNEAKWDSTDIMLSVIKHF